MLNQFKCPTLKEASYIILYLGVWLFPVFLSWCIAINGASFSLIAHQWQGSNLNIVGMCILVSFMSGVSSAFVVFSCLKKPQNWQLPKFFISPLSSLQRFVLLVICILSAIGLFKSFGGTIFEKSYAGPNTVWLGYGAWSATFLLTLCLLVGDVYRARPPGSIAIVAFFSIVFLPYLFSGSRIDFLSTMLALMAYTLFLQDKKFKIRLLVTLAIFIWAGLVGNLIGSMRYVFNDSLQTFSGGYALYEFSSPFKQPIPVEGVMLYISTFGDMGVSVFQIVGLIQKQLHDFIGLDYALLIYLARLLPGPFFSNRPTDFYLQLSESIGGGSLHALGEGYLISGLMGCGLIGAFFGVLIAVSMIAGNLFQVTRSPIMWIIFLFPWLLLIRGGWYQFFSFLKSLEILLLLIFFLVVIDLISKKVQKYFN